jgi:sugar lactone lactonase YvrE
MAQHRITLSPGPEDFALQKEGPNGPRLLIAARNRKFASKDPGRLWSLDLATLAKKTLTLPRQVWPAGVTLHNGNLYFTNDPPKGPPSIEVFALDGDTLTHADSFPNEKVKLPNDVIVHPSGDLYVTDFNAGILYRVDAKTKQWTALVHGISGPNGLATDGSRFFVSALWAEELHVYDAAGTLQRAVALPGLPDNLQWEVEGSVLNVALHRTKFWLRAHIVLPSTGSASRVCRVDAGTLAVQTIADFDDFAGGSSALLFEKKLYLSQVMRDQILIQDV